MLTNYTTVHQNDKKHADKIDEEWVIFVVVVVVVGNGGDGGGRASDDEYGDEAAVDTDVLGTLGQRRDQ